MFRKRVLMRFLHFKALQGRFLQSAHPNNVNSCHKIPNLLLRMVSLVVPTASSRFFNCASFYSAIKRGTKKCEVRLLQLLFDVSTGSNIGFRRVHILYIGREGSESLCDGYFDIQFWVQKDFCF